MRGWVLLALARGGISDAELLFVLEELDTGVDAYLVAAAARALRSYPTPLPAFAPFVIRAVTHIRYSDDRVSFERYGEYATSGNGTSPIRELLATLTWLGPAAREVIAEVESLRARGGLPRQYRGNVEQAVQAIRAGDQRELDSHSCCALPRGPNNMFSRAAGSRRESKSIEGTVFQDQDGTSVTFREFFRGRPTIVVFFYTRCDNPLKCSLTITKLAQVQKLLEARGLAGEIQTAAITYDPGFDLPDRLRSYGQARGARMDAHHRILRAVEGFTALCRQFRLGVNFVESLVNRHKIEAYILDVEGRIASRFERTHWDEQQLVDRSMEVLAEKKEGAVSSPLPRPRSRAAPQMLGMLAVIAVAFFPKCPLCWAAYLSAFGIAGLEHVPYSPWLRPVFVLIMLINLATVWLRRHSTGGVTALGLVAAGTLTILIFQLFLGWEGAAMLGAGLTLAGSLLSVLTARTAGAIPPSSQLNAHADQPGILDLI